MTIRDGQSCRCGSGLQDYALIDAAGIFCTYVCDKCIAEKKKRFKPQIFDSSHPYAASGDEDDIY